MYFHRLFAGLSLILSLLQSAGCTSNDYQVEMSFNGEGLHRRVTGWRE
jgi:hypothetical protein